MQIDFEKFKTLDELKDFVMVKKSCSRGVATKWCKENVPLEAYYQRKIIDYLEENYPDSFVRKLSLGAYSKGGTPDILFIHKGRYIGFEVKRPYFGIISKLQEHTIKAIRKAGGVAEVVTYVSDVIRVMERVEEKAYEKQEPV